MPRTHIRTVDLRTLMYLVQDVPGLAWRHDPASPFLPGDLLVAQQINPNKIEPQQVLRRIDGVVRFDKFSWLYLSELPADSEATR